MQLLDYFTPPAESESELYARVAAWFDRDELQRRKESKEKGFTTAEILDNLRSLEGR